MHKLHTSKTFLKMVGGKMYSLPLILPPGSVSDHKQQKPSKESGLFQSLSTINFVFLLKDRVKRGGHGQPCSVPEWFGVSFLRQP